MKQQEEFDKLALAFSALMHDLNHTGKSNKFMIAKLTDLAIIYNDKSVLEMHHVSQAFRMMQDPKYDIFCEMSNANF